MSAPRTKVRILRLTQITWLEAVEWGPIVDHWGRRHGTTLWYPSYAHEGD